MKSKVETYDVVVCGGGLAGFCAAVSAARQGLKACLVHERPVLGGVASSEMRVTVHGASCHHPYARETGLIGEILNEERFRNHEPINENGWTNPIFDMTLYDVAMREPNLKLHLNTVVTDVVMEAGSPAEAMPTTLFGYYERPACNASRRITALVARTLSAEMILTLQAPVFVDCSGDGFVADRAGCGWRMGGEGRAETGEVHAMAAASTDTMGNSIHIRAKDLGREAPYELPSWAVLHDNADFFYKQGRPPDDPRGGYWWIEIGVPWHTIYDNEEIRHQLTRHALGVWNWMKNLDPVMKERCRNYALDFIGQVPGKRDSRRIQGRHWLTEGELAARTRFPDEVAYGGWFIDLHTPGGLLAPTSEPHSAQGYCEDSDYAAKSHVGPYGLPLRALMAADIDNLYMAGRCISTSHAALATVRTMGTTALMGQAVGTAVAISRARGMDLPALAKDAAEHGPVTREIQNRLMRDGCFLPSLANVDPADLARTATASASSEARSEGMDAETRMVDNGQRLFNNLGRELCLDKLAGHLVCVAGGRLDSIALCMSNKSRNAVQLSLRLVRQEGYWDYRADGAAEVATGTVQVPAGQDRWVTWPLGLKGLTDGWYRIEASPAPGLAWRVSSGLVPGHVGVYALSPTRRRFRHNTFAFKVAPPQSIFAAANVLTGVTRPGNGTNLWRSDPSQSMPQWLALSWSAPTTVKRVELTFSGHTWGEVHQEPGFFRDAQTVRDYAIEVDRGDSVWVEVARVSGNYKRQRGHDLPQPECIRRLRLMVLATNGDPAAAVYEIRCY